MTDNLSRSFVHHRLEQLGARFADIGSGGDSVLVATSVGSGDELAAARRMGLVDLSPLPRLGYKGVGAPAWLQQQTLQLPQAPNTAVQQADGTLVAALSAQEHLLLSPLTPPADGCCRRLAAAWSLDSAPQCYQLPRFDSHCWFAVSGDCAGEMLAKLCGVDLRAEKFVAGGVAQTSLARLTAIVIRVGVAPAPLFYLLCDSASAEYLWDCLLDAMTEFNGAVVGVSALADFA